ncbi:MAG: 3-dehydroquinate synthase [Desulfobacteraceae bacterium]
MKTVHVKVKHGGSSVYVGETLQQVSQYLPRGKVIIITDETVEKIYRPVFPDVPVIIIPTGEGIKTLATCEMIYQKLIEFSADRNTFILGIGGGIVCDITGFTASTYMRGVKFGFVSTTLLSQVDASVGGKNGVNFNSYKNMVGVFCQPEFVICDISLLNTLPAQEVSNGFAEIVKHGLIADPALFEFIASNVDKALGLDFDVIEKLVYDSVRIKAEIVEKDEKEADIRRLLNFGHTLGHALEKTAADKHLSHGMAVSIGMVAASEFSRQRGFLTDQDCLRIRELLQGLHLPVTYDADPARIIEAVQKDKKRDANTINFVFLEQIGKAFVEKTGLTRLEHDVRSLWKK